MQGQGWQGAALCLPCWARCCIAVSPSRPAWGQGGWGSAGVEQGSTKLRHVLALPLPHVSYLDKGQSQARGQLPCPPRSWVPSSSLRGRAGWACGGQCPIGSWRAQSVGGEEQLLHNEIHGK